MYVKICLEIVLIMIIMVKGVVYAMYTPTEEGAGIMHGRHGNLAIDLDQ